MSLPESNSIRLPVRRVLTIGQTPTDCRLDTNGLSVLYHQTSELMISDQWAYAIRPVGNRCKTTVSIA
ncbi:MAG: hypothetical protein IKP48_10265 [Bacteroidaceae bacterium]|nr:hypothetical protein [Bacteroidaceae bacterium]